MRQERRRRPICFHMRMSPQERAQLNAVAKRLGMSAAAFVRHAIAAQLEGLALMAEAMGKDQDGS